MTNRVFWLLLLVHIGLLASGHFAEWWLCWIAAFFWTTEPRLP